MDVSWLTCPLLAMWWLACKHGKSRCSYGSFLLHACIVSRTVVRYSNFHKLEYVIAVGVAHTHICVLRDAMLGKFLLELWTFGCVGCRRAVEKDGVSRGGGGWLICRRPGWRPGPNGPPSSNEKFFRWYMFVLFAQPFITIISTPISSLSTTKNYGASTSTRLDESLPIPHSPGYFFSRADSWARQ